VRFLLVTLYLLLPSSSTPYWDEWGDPAIQNRVAEFRSLRRQQGIDIQSLDECGMRLLGQCASDIERGAVYFEVIEAYTQKGLPNPARVQELVTEALRFVESPPRRAILYCYGGDASRIRSRDQQEQRIVESVQWYGRGLREIQDRANVI